MDVVPDSSVPVVVKLPAANVDSAAPSGEPRRCGRTSAIRRLTLPATLACLSAVCIAAAPALLVHTSFRNTLLATAIHSDTLTAVAGSADGGWFQPLVFHDLLLRDANGQVSCRIGRVETSKGLLAHLTDSTSLHLAVHDAALQVQLNADGSWPNCGRQGHSDSVFSWSIHNAAFQLNAPWRPLPIVDLDKLQLDGRIEPDSEGHRQLSIEPFAVLDHTAISDDHASQNLALIAPILSRTTRIDGSASVQFEAITVPLDGATANAPFPLRGIARFHSLEASVREDFLGQLTKLIPATGLQMPSRIAVLDETSVRFEVTEHGIRHDSMVVLLPELARNLQITTSGTIRLDEQLDLELTLNLPQLPAATDADTGNTPVLALLAGLTKEPLRLRVTGTVSAPQFLLPDGVDAATELLRRLAPEVVNSAPPSVPSAVTGLIRSISSEDKTEATRQLPGTIINLIRAVDKSAKARRKQKQQRSQPSTEADREQPM
ncbi:MAG: hypothetical protein ACKO2P_00925 [Planctomycetota bacterium]